MTNQKDRPIYYDGSRVNSISPKTYKEWVSKPKVAIKTIKYPCFPYLPSNN
ncbi:hypothetical protein [Bacillus seohaeanensis]|uniref:Uncharacterized protein n=1 Tax=Bacillus seohaeanensis TaxID=284580 RepID=A0ABW5RM62_9BACI